MTYKNALKMAEKIGVSKVEGLPLLAITIQTLAGIHAINPELAYNGAVKQKLTSSQVRGLDPVNLGNLMFV